MGAWDTSARNSVLRLNMACECVRSSAPPAAQSSGNTSRQPGRASRPDAHEPLEHREPHHQQHDEPVLEHVGQRPCSPRSRRARAARRAGRCARTGRRPGPGSRSGQCRAQRARPVRSSTREHPHGEDEEARHVVVVLGPRVLLGLARGQGVVDGRRHGEELRRRAARSGAASRARSAPPPRPASARSATTSTAGGSDVSEAAASRMRDADAHLRLDEGAGTRAAIAAARASPRRTRGS